MHAYFITYLHQFLECVQATMTPDLKQLYLLWYESRQGNSSGQSSSCVLSETLPCIDVSQICRHLSCVSLKADSHSHSRQNLLPIRNHMKNANMQYPVSDPVVQTDSFAAHVATEIDGDCHCAGHLSLTICDTSTLADRRRELHMLAQMATYTMSLLNGTHTLHACYDSFIRMCAYCCMALHFAV